MNMGHSRLGYLPQSFDWQDLIGLIAQGGDPAAVAAATMEAAAEAFEEAAKDAGVRHVFHLLTQIPLAARQDDFALGLRDIAVTVPANPSLFDLIAGVAESMDEHLLPSRKRTHFGEMAQMAAAESLAAVAGPRSASRYGTTPTDVKSALAGL